MALLCKVCRGRCQVPQTYPSTDLGICPTCAGKGHDGNGPPMCPTCRVALTATPEGLKCWEHGLVWQLMHLTKATGAQHDQNAIHCVVIVDVTKQSVGDIIRFACTKQAAIASDLSQELEDGPFYIVQFPGGEQQSLNRKALEAAIEALEAGVG